MILSCHFVKMMMLSVWSLTMFLSLLLPTVQSLPQTSSPAGPSLVFTGDSPGYAQLEDISVDGDLTLSLQFRTGASEAQLVYMRELTTGHHISLYLSEGALHLQVHPDTTISPLTEDTRLDDQEWHKVVLEFDDGLLSKDIHCKVDETLKSYRVSQLPLLSNAQYQTWLGGLPPSLSEESEAGYVGCIRDIRVLDTDRHLQDIQLTGATVEECGLTSLDFTTPNFVGPLLGVITETDQVGSVVMNLQAVTGDINSQIYYELIDNPHDYFSLDQTTGSLTIARPLERLTLAPPNNILTLTVTARAGSGKH